MPRATSNESTWLDGGLWLERRQRPSSMATAWREDDHERICCSWESLHAVMAAVWPDSGSPARVRALERTDFVPPPPAVAASEAGVVAEARPTAGAEAGAAPAAAAAAAAAEPPPSGSLAAALAADLARYAPDVTLRDLRTAVEVTMTHLFSDKERLSMAHMRQLLVRVHTVPAGRAAGCFQLGKVAQAAGCAGNMTPQRLELVMAYMEAAAAVAANAECELLSRHGSLVAKLVAAAGMPAGMPTGRCLMHACPAALLPQHAQHAQQAQRV